MVRLRTALLGGRSCTGEGDEDAGVSVSDSLVTSPIFSLNDGDGYL